MRKYAYVAGLFLFIFFLSPRFLPGRSLESFTLLPDSVFWNGYLLKKTSDDGLFWYAVLIKDDDTLAVFNRGFNRCMTRSAFIPLPGKNDSMLVVEQFSGGAHCCWSYILLNGTSDLIHVFFRSTDYPVGYSVNLEDLNQDGIPEWVQYLLTFDYFLVLSHAVSPIIPVVFKYEEDGLYPANPEFREVLLKDIHESRQILRNSLPIHTPIEWNSPDIDLFSHLLRVVLTLFYMGEYDQATAIFEKYYTARDSRIIFDQIMQKLDACQVFQSIYQRYQAVDTCCPADSSD
ncbi:MAG: hypothetical protein J7K63_09060 [Candidatus Marinimicrobia bacterium]|nr:hypothetical protein [Candidatus Neomarinimicrobiota bacterium]